MLAKNTIEKLKLRQPWALNGGGGGVALWWITLTVYLRIDVRPTHKKDIAVSSVELLYGGSKPSDISCFSNFFSAKRNPDLFFRKSRLFPVNGLVKQTWSKFQINNLVLNFFLLKKKRLFERHLACEQFWHSVEGFGDLDAIERARPLQVTRPLIQNISTQWTTTQKDLLTFCLVSQKRTGECCWPRCCCCWREICNVGTTLRKRRDYSEGICWTLNIS